MSYQRLAYDDQDNGPQMQADCAVCAVELNVSRRTLDVTGALEEAPSLEYDEFPVDLPKRGTVTVSEAAAHLASRLHLHLD